MPITIIVPGGELWDEDKEVFISEKDTVLSLEHSLVSLSKWESKWCIPFLSKTEKTFEQSIDYIVCMTITQNVDSAIYKRITPEQIAEIEEYISRPMTATVISSSKKQSGRETITAELIYYWMVASQIPFECQKWHLNRLLTLIQVCSIKNTPPKKRSPQEIASRNQALNAQRRQALGSKG